MYLRKKRNKIIYIVGTIVNLCLGIKFLGNNMITIFLFIGILSNQLFLKIGISRLLSPKSTNGAITGSLFLAKLLILVGIIVYAMQKTEGKTLIIISIYIFQLIILVISNKRLS